MTDSNFDTYRSLCTEVYELSKPEAPEEDLAFYRSYAVECDGPVLEPMCGSGRFLLPLLQEVLNIHGFDASEHMLNVLRTKANKLGLEPRIWRGLAQQLQTDERYSLIFIPSGSFCLITDNKAIKNSLKALYEHLDENGVLLFEVETPKAVPPQGIWRGSKWSRDDGNTILLSSCAVMEGDICTSFCKYELIVNNTIVQTEVEEYNIKIYETGLLTSLLKEAGFQHMRVIKAFDKDSLPAENDESIVYECRKTEWLADIR